VINSYPKIFNLGHAAIKDLLTVPVCMEEKIDGSQISFGMIDGELKIRSKGADINPDAPNSMFSLGVTEIKKLAPILHPEWIYRGEYLRKPKHNTLSYSRTPNKYIIIFDIQSGNEEYLGQVEKYEEALKLGLETVPILNTPSSGHPTSENLKQLLEIESVLGGTKIEGVVIKPYDYNLYGEDKKVLMGKYVSEEFKEKHNAEWKGSNPTNRDVLYNLGEIYRKEARWEKAMQHLRDAGEIQNSPRDIGPLILSVKKDVQEECEMEIKEFLWRWAWPHVQRKIVAGLPEWWKQKLIEKQFE
jgi:tetratricopeptide (TPR) repeat protein